MPKPNKNTSKVSAKALSSLIFDDAATEVTSAAVPPKRLHSAIYHRPRLRSDLDSSLALLRWFDTVEERRQMPWRKAWINPANFKDPTDLLQAINRRAYEVWVSEIMLQQTRVSVVISYFNNWISKWPTVEELAQASQDDVLAAWKGLGYYSRATRLHEAAQQIVEEMGGVIPSDVEGLLKIKGVGRYTAGAVSSIVFGKPVPLLDGNVARVLTRQLGLYAKVKDKKVDDLLWDAAGVLVQTIARAQSGTKDSDVAGRWNQAMMELGSTICTPKPKCEDCPIQPSCRAYAEGAKLVELRKTPYKEPVIVADIEDACTLCEEMELEDVEDDEKATINVKTKRKRAASTTLLPTRPLKSVKGARSDIKQRSLRDFASFKSDRAETVKQAEEQVMEDESASAEKLDQIKQYCSLFPKREPKKKVPEQECLVCVIRHAETARYLIEQRPKSGLLASLWQFPNLCLPRDTQSTAKSRLADSKRYVDDLLADVDGCEIRSVGAGGHLTHVFSHLRLQAYVYIFELSCNTTLANRLLSRTEPKRLWIDAAGVDKATLGTGMKRCWDLVKDGAL